MNVVFMAIINALLVRSRTCPKCGKKQAVSSEKKHQSVRCKFCGAEIPPPE